LQCERRPSPITVRCAVARAVHCCVGMDFVALLIALGFFAASWGFVAFCERLRG
jgi:hypothetical protein